MRLRTLLKKGTLLAFMVWILAAPSLAEAWSQAPHSQINSEAITLFLRQMKGKEKFSFGPLAEDALNKPLRGVAVDSSSLLASGFVSKEASLSMRRWIIMGGDWADEPHLYSSVRHFYDPLELSGAAYLTDQSWAHGLYDSPQIDARTWGLDHPENPFTLFSALSAYKAALEVRDDIPLPPQISAPHFKTTLNLVARDSEDQRALYLSRAYRALGESMHMLGDMTQPAHVRNDSHPADEPIEVSIFAEHVRRAAANPFIDPRIRPFLASAGGTLQDPAELFRRIALFTNSNFYSMDTIYDGPSGVFPNNLDPLDILEGRQRPYSSPQFKDLEEEKATVRGFVMQRTVKRYWGVFDGTKRAPMAQERLSFHWFDPEQSFLGGFDAFKEKAGRAAAVRFGRLGRYHVPHAFGPPQGEVLLPMAIHACADLMDLFFPTLELKAEFEEQEPSDDTEEAAAKKVAVTSVMEHQQEKDPAWSAFDLKISYSGPAEMVVLEHENMKEKEVYVRKLHFNKGALEKIETKEGDLEAEDLRLFVARSGVSLTEEESFYELKNGQSVLLRIDAGSRRFESPSWTLDEPPEVSILPPRILILELGEGASEAEHEFEAAATPKAKYLFEWDFGDGSKTAEEEPAPGKKSVQTHRYSGLKEGDSFSPRVKLFDDKGNLLAEDSISITVTRSKRHFFENRTFWLTGSPFANDPSVVFPEVPISIVPGISGISGEIDPKSAEGKRLENMVRGMSKAVDSVKEQMLKEMAKMGVSLSDSQLNEAMQQALSLGGIDFSGSAMERRPILGSGYSEAGKPATISLALSIPPIPPVPVSMPGTPPLEGRVTVRRWFFTTGHLSSREVSGSGGTASVSWTPEKGKTPEAFSLDLVISYSLDFYKRGTGEVWLDGGAPVRYSDMSVTFPVGIYFCPVR
jgi:hypothetical protein